MGIELVVGRQSRDGLSMNQWIYKEIGRLLDAGKDKLFLIVPEQFTLGAERELMEANNLNGLMGADVLSFKRLEYRILAEVGGITKTFVDDHGKQMLLQKIIGEVKKNLTVYKKSAQKIGFLENICEMISELKQSDIRPESLEKLIDTTMDGRLLGQKLQDILMIYKQFGRLLGADRMDKEDRSALLCEKIPESHYLENAQVFLSGFYTFSNLDFKIIEALAGKVSRLTMALTTDIDEYAPDASAFVIPNKTLKRMETIAKTVGCDFKIHRMENKENKTDGISHLERNLFSYKPEPFQGVPAEIEVAQCKTTWEEVEAGARKINELVREQGYRYEDIVVLAGDIETYGGLIKRAFSAYDIPFFMDDVKKVTENNFLEAILSALETVQKNYTYEELFSYIKTGFSTITLDESEMLENYAIEFGLRGKDWEKPFDKESRDEVLSLETLNEIRERLISPFIQFKKELYCAKTCIKKTTALFNFLEATGAQDSIDQLTEKLRIKEDYDTMGIYNQIWNILMEVFDQIVETMGEDTMSLEEYIMILKSGFSSYTVGIIPSRLDVVNIIDLFRSRSGKMKALIVLGVNEGVLPSSGKGFNLLSERERNRLKEQEIELQNNTDFRLAQEEFTIYSLFSRPENDLYLSFAMADTEGNSLGISTLLGRIRSVFPELKIKSALDTSIYKTWEMVSGAKGTLGKLTDYLRDFRYGKRQIVENEAAIWQAVSCFYEKSAAYKEDYKKIQEALHYDGIDDTLSAGQAVKLFEPPLQASVSRLERYRQCPYAHFVQYGLKPVPRQEYTVEAPDIGIVLHNLIDTVYKQAEEMKIPVEDLTESQSNAMVEQILDEMLPTVRHQIFKSSGQYQYLGRKIKRIGKRTVRVLSEHMRKGSFDFKYSEQLFNQVLKLPNFNETVKIKGIIDRLDIYEKEGDTFVKVIDYKSGNKKLNLAEIYYGLSLQLLVYMEAGLTILEGDNLVPGGTFYFHVDDPLLHVDNLNPETLTRAVNDSFKLNGIYLDDSRFTEAMDLEAGASSSVISLKSNNSKLSHEEFDELLRYVKEVIVEMSEQILGGDVAIRPYKKGNETGCDYCDYNGICQFDVSIGKASYDVLKATISKTELMEKIGKEDENNAVD